MEQSLERYICAGRGQVGKSVAQIVWAYLLNRLDREKVTGIFSWDKVPNFGRYFPGMKLQKSAEEVNSIEELFVKAKIDSKERKIEIPILARVEGFDRNFGKIAKQALENKMQRALIDVAGDIDSLKAYLRRDMGARGLILVTNSADSSSYDIDEKDRSVLEAFREVDYKRFIQTLLTKGLKGGEEYSILNEYARHKKQSRIKTVFENGIIAELDRYISTNLRFRSGQRRATLETLLEVYEDGRTKKPMNIFLSETLSKLENQQIDTFLKTTIRIMRQVAEEVTPVYQSALSDLRETLVNLGFSGEFLKKVQLYDPANEQMKEARMEGVLYLLTRQRFNILQVAKYMMEEGLVCGESEFEKAQTLFNTLETIYSPQKLQEALKDIATETPKVEQKGEIIIFDKPTPARCDDIIDVEFEVVSEQIKWDACGLMDAIHNHFLEERAESEYNLMKREIEGHLYNHKGLVVREELPLNTAHIRSLLKHIRIQKTDGSVYEGRGVIDLLQDLRTSMSIPVAVFANRVRSGLIQSAESVWEEGYERLQDIARECYGIEPLIDLGCIGFDKRIEEALEEKKMPEVLNEKRKTAIMTYIRHFMRETTPQAFFGLNPSPASESSSPLQFFSEFGLRRLFGYEI